MPRYLKDVLYKGKWHPKSGVVEFTDAHLASLAQRGNDMLAAGLEIPLIKEHLDGAIPMSRNAALKELCDGVLGWTKRFVVDQSVLKAEVEATDDDAGKKIEGLRFASPELLHNWKDGKGREWADMSITHIAATPFPVQYPQQPFQRLSRIRLAREDYAADDSDGDSPPPKEDKPEPPELKGDTPPDRGGMLKKVVAALVGCKIVLPPDTSPDNLLDRLYTALLTYKAATGDTTPGGGDPSQTPQVEQPTMNNLAFSQADADKLKAMESRMLTMHKADLRRRVDRLRDTGRIDPDLHKKLVADLGNGKLQFSLSTDGELDGNNKLVAMIEAYEALKPGTAAPVGSNGTQLSITEAPRPEGWQTVEEHNAAVRQQAAADAAKFGYGKPVIVAAK